MTGEILLKVEEEGRLTGHIKMKGVSAGDRMVLMHILKDRLQMSREEFTAYASMEFSGAFDKKKEEDVAE